MDRRRYLVVALAAATAGCGLGGSGDQQDNGQQGNSTDGESTVTRTEIDEAVNLLVENADALAALADPEETRVRSESDLDPVRDRLDTVEDRLGEGEASADADADRLDEARAVATVQRRLVGNHAASIAFVSDFESAFQTITTVDQNTLDGIAEELLPDVMSAFEDAQSQLTDLQDRRTDLVAARDQVDGSLAEPTLAYTGDLDQYVRYSTAQLSAVETVLTAYDRSFVGTADLFRGRADFDAQRWDEAEQEFTSARDAFQTAFDLLGSVDTSLLQPFGAETVGEFTDPAVLDSARLQFDEYLEITSLSLEATTLAASGSLTAAQDPYDEATRRLRSTFS